jgi:hypothetical protein
VNRVSQTNQMTCPINLADIYKSYNLAMGSLEERMEDFAPSVIVKRDGVEVEIPMAEFMADAEESEPDEAPA